MIRIENGLFILETAHTSYLFRADETGNLVHLYYGERVELSEGALQALAPKCVNQNGCSIIADQENNVLCLDDVCLEISARGKGDMREPFVEIIYADGSRTSDFRYEGSRIEEKKCSPDKLPGAIDEEEQVQSLVVTMADRNSKVRLELIYSVFEACDCITRFARVINEEESAVTLLRLMSAQLDLEAFELKVTSFHGDWTREMGRFDTLLQAGKYVNEATTGFSSNKANPFIMFGEAQTTEEHGNCYACNLIYFGNHRESIEAGGHAKMRMLTGIHPDFFTWRLEAGDSFTSPEAVLTFSAEGYRGISKNMHAFVREHIVRGTWKKKERPVLLNSWEAMYFNIQERRVLKLAKAAAEAGIELFVLDDGWFGKRNSDKTSLGDWYDNMEKLPGGLAGLSKKIREMGLLFGIWVEPEMISEDSELYRAHPDWAVRIPGKAHSLGRNQMLLDLTRTEVQDYIIESMSDVFTRSKAAYVKWDMNRHMSDYYSQGLEAKKQGEFAHRYILGLYRVLEELTTRFPDVLFEACASGGNRFDLGMICYMPQVWASDNTDAISRSSIQNGYSYGYPQSVIGAHVSSCPNHQTLRITPHATRFAIASAGILGYECNLSDLSTEELKEIAQEVSLYKKWRQTLQFGQWYRIKPGKVYGQAGVNVPYDADEIQWCIVSKDKEKAVGITLQGQVVSNFSHHKFCTAGLDEKKLYHFYNQNFKYDIRRMGDLINTVSPVHIKQDSFVHDILAKFVRLDAEKEDFIVYGSLLNKCGVQLGQCYAGTGFESGTAIYQDYDTKMYFMEAVQ